MSQTFKNNAASMLAEGISDAAVSLTVVSGEGALFPTITGDQYFTITLIERNPAGKEINWEILKVTARSGDTMIVQRAQEGTTAQAWDEDTPVELRVTAGAVSRWEQGAKVHSGMPANSILVADAAGTPVAKTVAASRIIGRAASGAIGELTPTQVRTIAQVIPGTHVQAQNSRLQALANANNLATARAVLGARSVLRYKDGSAQRGVLFGGMGNSNFRSAQVASSPTPYNPNVFVWQDDGISDPSANHMFRPVDLTQPTPVGILSNVAYTSVVRDSRGSAMYAMADAANKDLGIPAYFIQSALAGQAQNQFDPAVAWAASSSSWYQFVTHLEAMFASTELVAAGITKFDALCWSYGSVDYAAGMTPMTWALNQKRIMQWFVDEGYADVNTQFLIQGPVEEIYVDGYLWNALGVLDSITDDNVHIVSARGLPVVASTPLHLTGDACNDYGANRLYPAFIAGRQVKQSGEGIRRVPGGTRLPIHQWTLNPTYESGDPGTECWGYTTGGPTATLAFSRTSYFPNSEVDMLDELRPNDRIRMTAATLGFGERWREYQITELLHNDEDYVTFRAVAVKISTYYDTVNPPPANRYDMTTTGYARSSDDKDVLLASTPSERIGFGVNSPNEMVDDSPVTFSAGQVPGFAIGKLASFVLPPQNNHQQGTGNQKISWESFIAWWNLGIGALQMQWSLPVLLNFIGAGINFTRPSVLAEGSDELIMAPWDYAAVLAPASTGNVRLPEITDGMVDIEKQIVSRRSSSTTAVSVSNIIGSATVSANATATFRVLPHSPGSWTRIM